MSEPAKPSGRFGNKNAVKPASKKLLTHLHIPCGIRDKRAWHKQAKAHGLGISKWVRKVLNAASTNEL